MFLDEANIEITSGRGGAGVVSFHREKHVPRGGPDGADGGRGGSVYLVADRGKRTLYDFKFQPHFKAAHGTDAVSNKTGKNGKDLEVRVPVGTVVIDLDLDDQLVDLSFDGARYRICKGGRGGFGNLHYTNSVRQVPRFAQKGEPEETVRIRLELKLVADIGIVGLPNAGKSTLISRISAAKPKIADYPFTTIVPNLGVVTAGDESFTVADMPGLIEGASEGHGLGHQFLRHVERTSALVHLVEVDPIDMTNPVENYQLIEAELAKYSEEISRRPRIVCITKTDTVTPGDVGVVVEWFKEIGVEALPISAATDDGIEDLTFRMLELVHQATKHQKIPTLLPELKRVDDGTWNIEKLETGFAVTGKRLDKLVAMTNLDNEDALYVLHRKLERIGVIDKLRKMGAKDGDEVSLGEFIFSFEVDE